MSTTVYPGTTTKISCTDAPTGLAGTLKWQLKQGTTVIQTRNASNVEEDPAGSGIYLVQVTWPTTTGRYRFIADTGTITPDTVAEEEIIVSYSRPDVPATDGPAYTTPDALRAALEESRDSGKGVSLYVNGQSIPAVVVSVDDRYVVARSQAQGKIVVRLERIDGVAGFIGERKAP